MDGSWTEGACIRWTGPGQRATVSDGQVLDRGRLYQIDGSWTEGDCIRWTGPGQRATVSDGRVLDRGRLYQIDGSWTEGACIRCVLASTREHVFLFISYTRPVPLAIIDH